MRPLGYYAQQPLTPPDSYWAERDDTICPICEKRKKQFAYKGKEMCEDCTLNEMEKDNPLSWFESLELKDYAI